jgi:hypothetical protein
MNKSFKTRSAAIILMAAGYGWAGGHYIPSNSPLVAYLFQFIIIAVLLLFGVKFFGTAENKNDKGNWAIKGLNIFSVLFFLVNVLNIVHGFFNTDPSAFGSHNTFADLVPIIIILTSSGLWIVPVFSRKKEISSQN